MAGYQGDEATARLGLNSPDADVRSSALAALARLGCLGTDDLRSALADSAPGVRRRACTLAVAPAGGTLASEVVAALVDPDPGVVEAAAYALGEMSAAAGTAQVQARTVGALSAVATGHPDALCREAAVAGLGSLGAPDGLAAVLTACADKPAVRRRAVVALAAFEGPEADRALQAALADSDWQVRQAAEDLIGRDPGTP